ARLFRSNQLNPIAEIGLMIESYRHDDADGWLRNDVGRVEASTKTYLNNRDICRMYGEEKAHDRVQEYVDSDHRADYVYGNAIYRVSENGVSYQLATANCTEAIALVPIDQMRRGVDVTAVTGCLQQRTRKRRRRAFAIGPGNM